MKKVLVIDDEEDITRNLNSILKKTLGAEIKLATGFEKGMSVLRLYNPDLVFLDVNLGDGNGYNLLPYIKKSAVAPKIIMMSAYEGEKESQRAKEHGAHYFMQKPFTKENILEALEKTGML